MNISVNGKIIPRDKFLYPIDSSGFMYGYGIFETMKIVENKILFLEEHIDRLKNGCKILGLTLKYDFKDIKKYCYDLIHANGITGGVVKLTYVNGDNNTLIITTRKNSYKDEDYNRGFKVAFSDVKRNPYSKLVYVKSNNYLENILARREVVSRGYDEVIFENIHNEICEGAISNIFFIKNKKIYTPKVECGILSGIARTKVLELIKELNINHEVGIFDKRTLLEADEIFITNSLMDIMPISQVDNKTFNINNYNITNLLIDKFKVFIKEKI